MKKTLEETGQRHYWPLAQIVLARVREFYREPEAVFWVYGFPLILAGALGLAFTEKPVPASTVDVQDDPADPAATETLRAALAAGDGGGYCSRGCGVTASAGRRRCGLHRRGCGSHLHPRPQPR